MFTARKGRFQGHMYYSSDEKIMSFEVTMPELSLLNPEIIFHMEVEDSNSAVEYEKHVNRMRNAVETAVLIDRYIIEDLKCGFIGRDNEN